MATDAELMQGLTPGVDTMPQGLSFGAQNTWRIAADNYEEDVPFVPGEENIEFGALVSGAEATIVDTLMGAIQGELIRWGGTMGIPQVNMQQFFLFNWNNGGFDFFNERLQYYSTIVQRGGFEDFQEGIAGKPDLDAVLGTVGGFEVLVADVWRWYNGRAGNDLGVFGAAKVPVGGGRGARGPTDQDIRNQFDITELAEAADSIWRQMLLEDTPDARAMATSYVDAIVKGKGEVKIDFREYVRSRAMKTARFASIYINKPEELSPEDYLQRYAVAAQQVARPGNAADIAIGGAQFGSDASTFAARLSRTPAAMSSSSFINEIQGRLTDLNDVFKG